MLKRMHSPAIAIAWEIWRKNRWALWSVGALVPASFILASLFGNVVREIVYLFEFFAVLMSTAILFWSFSFMEMDAGGRHSGFPSRMFVLPVRTMRLVSYPVIYGIGTILAVYAVWVGAISLQWKVKVPWETILCETSVLTAMMVSIQAIVWALHRFNFTRMIVLIGVVTGLGLFGLFALDPAEGVNRTRLTIVSAAIALAAYVGALMAVEHDRRGELLGWLDRFYQTVPNVLPGRRKLFASFEQAQFWMEWRRRGWLLSCWGMLMALSLVLWPLSTALFLDSTRMLFNLASLPILTLWFTATMGMQLAKSDLWSPGLGLHPITAMRPISTGEVVMAKLKVAGVATVSGLILSALLAMPAMQAVGGPAHLNEDVLHFWSRFPIEHAALLHWAGNPVVVLTAIGVTWHVMVQGMCPALTGRVRKNIWAVGLGMSLFGIVAFTSGWLLQHPNRLPEFLAVLPWITGAILVWKWVTAAAAFLRAYRGTLYSRNQWKWLLTVWIALTVGVAVSAYLACAANQIPTAIILFLAVWLLPGGELAVCAENLAQNRHG